MTPEDKARIEAIKARQAARWKASEAKDKAKATQATAPVEPSMVKVGWDTEREAIAYQREVQASLKALRSQLRTNKSQDTLDKIEKLQGQLEEVTEVILVKFVQPAEKARKLKARKARRRVRDEKYRGLQPVRPAARSYGAYFQVIAKVAEGQKNIPADQAIEQVPSEVFCLATKKFTNLRRMMDWLLHRGRTNTLRNSKAKNPGYYLVYLPTSIEKVEGFWRPEQGGCAWRLVKIAKEDWVDLVHCPDYSKVQRERNLRRRVKFQVSDFTKLRQLSEAVDKVQEQLQESQAKSKLAKDEYGYRQFTPEDLAYYQAKQAEYKANYQAHLDGVLGCVLGGTKARYVYGLAQLDRVKGQVKDTPDQDTVDMCYKMVSESFTKKFPK